MLARLSGLLSCPFCRALFPADEASTCPECGLALVPMHRLPLSPEAEQLLEPSPEEPPEDRRFPWWAPGRGRGALLGLAVLGLVLFFMPWVELVMPESAVYSGFHLARGRAGWLWGGATGYFVLIPLIASRRNVHDLRGARVIAAFLAGTTLAETLFLLGFPPEGHGLLPLELVFRWGLFASAAVSLVATLVAARLGGGALPLPPTPGPPPEGPDPGPQRLLH